MAKPKVLMFARDKKNSTNLAWQLQNFFGDYLDIQCCYLEGGMPQKLDADLVLVTLQTYTRIVAPLVNDGTDIMVIRRTITVESWEMLQAIPSGTKAMLVNDAREAAEDTVALLHELGAKHLYLVPAYPENIDFPNLDFAITPGESEHVPAWVEKVVDIGPRVFDISTITDIIIKFKLMDQLGGISLSAYLSKIIPFSVGLKAALSNLAAARQQMEVLLDAITEGVVAYDNNGKITLFNRYMEQLSGKARWQIVGQSIPAFMVQSGLPKDLIDNTIFYDRVYDLFGKSFLISKIPLEAENSCPSFLLTFKETSQIEKQELKVRQDLRQKGLWAKYTFDNIVGASPAIKTCIELAKKMTRGDSVVLIQGESGVGKELFAQAIHNASGRKNGPFVAINCAALPETLLESELFGYEEGAFTGARKGGRLGLFEQAHKGTIFLDEVGDIPLSLQSRLLRVLQEKEVMRIGAARIIPVDVRVIAATNQSLEQLVESNLFRPDLYYRLNVLPLVVPPLRERKSDIPLIANYYLMEMGDRRRLNTEILGIFYRHSWPGNVRELQNCIDYLVHITDQDFIPSNLPLHLLKDRVKINTTGPEAMDLTYFILQQLNKAASLGETLGRYQLKQLAMQRDIIFSESKIRRKLEQLTKAGLINKVSGRLGHTISPQGVEVLQKIHNHNN